MFVDGFEPAGAQKDPDENPHEPEPPRPDALSARPRHRPSDQDRVMTFNAARWSTRMQDAGTMLAVRPSAPTDSISAERVAELLARVEEGYYDRPDVQRQIAENLIADLHSPFSG